MLVIEAAHLGTIRKAAEAAAPGECCGLLVGQTEGDVSTVTWVAESPNLLKGEHFEVDPQIRFDLMRDLRGREEEVIGHYHSHPSGSFRPSPRDIERAYEPDMIWLILSPEGQGAFIIKEGEVHDLPLIVRQA